MNILRKVKINLVLISVLFSAIFVLQSTNNQSKDPVEIIRKMENTMRGESAYTELKMEIVRPRYTREFSIRSWSLGEDYSLILITAPARDKGTAYLKRKNEIWNYVPGIDRLIKLPPSMMAQSWMGSDFSNDDLVRETSTIEDYKHTYIGTETIENRAAHKIELIPKADVPVVWSKLIIWVDIEHYFQLKTEHYDERDHLVSTILFLDIKNMDGKQLAVRMEYIPHDKQGHKTVIIQEKIQFNPPGLDESFFTIQNLERIR